VLDSGVRRRVVVSPGHVGDRSERLLVGGGTLVTGGSTPGIIEDGAVVVEAGRITAVGPERDVAPMCAGAPVLDASGKLVMPGFINAHTHLYSALARGITAPIEPSANFVEILEHLWWKLDNALDDEDVRLSAAAGALDLIRNGTTTIIDHHASQTAIRDSLSIVADALGAIGVRANLCFEVSDRWGSDCRNDGLAESERFARAAAGRGSELTASVGLHASMTLDDATLDRAAGIAKDFDIGCHVHVAEDRADVEDSIRRCGKRVVERFHSFGVLGSKTIAVHCVHVDGGEIELLAGTDTPIVHNPQSNMNNAVGCANVPRLLERGLLVGLGTDGFTASMLDELKVANLIHRHEAADPRVGHGVGATLCLDNNAEIARRLTGERLGRLEVGAPADIIVLDYAPPTPLASGNFAGHAIFGLTGWMVESVVIGGRMVLRDREFVDIDAVAILREARERARGLWEKM